MIFDKIITMDSRLDKVKAESVRQYHLAALKSVEAAPPFEKKDKTVEALRYSLEYIGRCQATFETLWEELFASQQVIEEMKLKNAELEGRVKQAQDDLAAVKKLFT